MFRLFVVYTFSALCCLLLYGFKKLYAQWYAVEYCVTALFTVRTAHAFPLAVLNI